jgi:acetyl esterase
MKIGEDVMSKRCFNGKAVVRWALGVISGFGLLTYALPNIWIALAKEPADKAGVMPGQTTEQAAEATAEVDPQVKGVLEKMAAAGVLHLTTVDQVRKAYLFYPVLSGKPEHVFRVEDRVIPGPAGNIPVRLYIPREGRGLPIWVFFHGGGFVAGSLDSHDTPLRAVANRCGCIVVSVAYRLAPQNPYPAAPDDAYAATKWISEHAAEIGGDARLIAVGGDGAGGNLAAVVTLMARDRGGPRLIYQVLIYPTLNAIMQASGYISKDPILTPDVRAAILAAYVPLTKDLADPYISPVSAKSLKNLPPAFLVTDQDDPARDEGDAYARRLAEDGVRVKVSKYPKMIHNFFLMAGELDAGKKAIEEIAGALRSAFESTSRPAQSAP